MDSLRDLLEQINPDLHKSLLETWQYLENKILPMMPVNLQKNESLNSLPHLRNNENYLNGILPNNKELFNTGNQLFLTPYELYSILTSIALHDIGRIDCGKGHGARSNEMIRKDWEKYKIPDAELSKAIGNICEIHEPKEMEDEKSYEIDIEISKNYIDINLTENNSINEILCNQVFPSQMLDNNKGYIRVNELGALLSLVDNMDASYRRLASIEVIGKDTYNTPIATIRQFIKGISYSPDCKAIIVTLEKKSVNNNDILKWFLEYNLFRPSNDLHVITISEAITKYNRYEKDFNVYLKESSDINDIFGITSFSSAKVKESFYRLIWSIINGVRIRELKFDDTGNKKFPTELLLPVVLSNVRAIHRSMYHKYKYLSRLGVPVKTWLIYMDEHLYNYYGQETFEPIFTKEYLKHVTDTMWKLSTRVFGKSFFSYEMLASAASEKDLNKIRLAVKRLEIISKDNKGLGSAINYNPNAWKWEFSEYETKVQGKKCDFMSCNDVKNIIDNNLGEPVL